jgi:hypothetical protein
VEVAQLVEHPERNFIAKHGEGKEEHKEIPDFQLFYPLTILPFYPNSDYF